MSMAVNKLFEYQRSKQNSINDIKNGRIDITGKYEQNSKMPLFSESSEGIGDYNLDTLAHSYEGNTLQYMFFSKENIDHLQKLLRSTQSHRMMCCCEHKYRRLLMLPPIPQSYNGVCLSHP